MSLDTASLLTLSPSAISASLSRVNFEWADNDTMVELGIFYCLALAGSAIMFWGLTTFLYVRYYIYQGDRADEWKQQAAMPPTSEVWLAIKYCTFNWLFGNTVVAAIAYLCYHGKSQLYWGLSEQPLWWTVVSSAVIFVFHDSLQYYIHAMLHTPMWYKRIHKIHHIFKQPTPWTALAMHPLEFFMFASPIYASPFMFPVWVPFLLAYYGLVAFYAVCDHSGVDIWLPWPMDCAFHDTHHVKFNYNYAQFLTCLDDLHGTRYLGDDLQKNKEMRRARALANKTK